MIFRSYKPIDSQSFEKPVENRDQMTAVERVIGNQLKDTTDTTVKDTLVSSKPNEQSPITLYAEANFRN